MGAHQSVSRGRKQLAGIVANAWADVCACLRRGMLRALAPALLVAGVLVVSASAAQAAPPKLISYGNFSAKTWPLGVAVDQSTSDVYVGNVGELSTFTPGNIDKFDAANKMLPPSPFGSAFFSGVTVNPINGEVYAVNWLAQSIETYDPTSGAQLASFPIASINSPFELLVQIAADSAGNVYVPNAANNEVLEYSPEGALLRTFTGSGAGALNKPSGVAVDSSGNVWVADAGNNRIEEFNPAGAVIGEIKSEGVQSVALDTHGDVFATVNNKADFCGSVQPPCIHLVEFDSTGTQVADIGAGSFGEIAENPFRLPSIVAVNESSGLVYVTDTLKNRVLVYAPPSPPVIGSELAAEVSSTEAKLGALINPGGIDTNYRFEYGTSTEYGNTTPFPEGNVGEGVTSRTVWASANDLAPGTTYHYRVIATSELGTVVGADHTFTTETAAQVTCPNEGLRVGFSAKLPDCRAYELVNPPTDTSAQPDPQNETHHNLNENIAATDGNRMAYWSYDILAGSASSGENYVSARGPSGWMSENVIPVQSYTGDRCSNNDTAMPAYSADLSKGVLIDGRGETPYGGASPDGGCGAELEEVVPGEPQGVANLLLREDAGKYQLINMAPIGVTPVDAQFKGASSDLSHVIFGERAQLTANALGGGAEDLYEWAGGEVHLLTVLPDGTPVVGSLAVEWQENQRVISADGSHVFFSAGGNLYLRLNGSSTVQVDASQAGGNGGGGVFQDASANGSQAFFTDEASSGLTSDTVPGSGKNLYLYAGGQLTDITSGNHAEVEGVEGVSADGSYVYFVAREALSGAQQNQRGEMAQGGQRNLYLYHEGTTTFIATLNAEDAGRPQTRVSPSGTFFAFAARKSLTGYNSTDAGGVLAEEIFLYSAASNQLVCVSCNPSGEAPPSQSFPPYGGATMVDRWQGAPHYLSDGGRLFFETVDGLVPSDTNGQTDVYEYQSGRLNLISSGTSSSESLLLDASESGDDIFFLTRQKLVPQDTEEEALSIYDARVDGGFPALASPPPCTTADSCRTPVSPQPAIYGAPSSQTFSGVGNLVSPPAASPTVKPRAKPAKCKKGTVKSKGKCVRKKARRGNGKKPVHANKRTGK